MKKSIHLAALGIMLILASGCKSSDRGSGKDWLLEPDSYKAQISETDGGKSILLENGLISRTFRLAPNCATVDFQNLMTGEAVIRAIRPARQLPAYINGIC